MLSFHVSQPDNKVKFLYPISMRVLQQHIIIPAFSIAQISENILLINVSISWTYEEMIQGMYGGIAFHKNMINYGTLPWLPTPSTAEVKEEVELYLYSS
jgi:hypothetical protein